MIKQPKIGYLVIRSDKTKDQITRTPNSLTTKTLVGHQYHHHLGYRDQIEGENIWEEVHNL